MSNCNALYQKEPMGLSLPALDLGQLPAKLSKKLWVNPSEFLIVSNALSLAKWALWLSQGGRPLLPEPSRRGPKLVYQAQSVLVMALVQVAWQLSYEEL